MVDSEPAGLVMGKSWVRFPAAALSGNDLGQVVHTFVPLFTKQCNLYLARAFTSMRLYVEAIHGPSEQGEYCNSGSAAIRSLSTTI